MIVTSFLLLNCNKNDEPINTDKLQLVSVKIGLVNLSLSEKKIVQANEDLVLSFAVALNPQKKDALKLIQMDNQVNIDFETSLADNDKLIILKTAEPLKEGQDYLFEITNELSGALGESFEGISFEFAVAQTELSIVSIQADGVDLIKNFTNKYVSLEPEFIVEMSHDVPVQILQEEVFLIGPNSQDLQISRTVLNSYSIKPKTPLKDFSKYSLIFPPEIGQKLDRPFDHTLYKFFTALDSTPDFPAISDEELLTLIQSQTFKYFWEGGHPASGMAKERNSSGNTVTSGGSGFGLMSMIVGVERGFITRDEAIARWDKIITFLENADRFHGAWSHWMNGNTGKAIPFSTKDNGGDLVETAFLIQGLLTVRQYLDADNISESNLIFRINQLWESVEWDWYTKGGQNVLYWHWSPQYNWDMNLQIRGHNETQIIYVLAASSPTHDINKLTYDNGYAQNGNIKNGSTYYGYELPIGYGRGGPLFFTHYSYLGLDPRNLVDQYADYWQQNRNHTLINRAYCIDNPKNFIGYSEDCWGLTASDNHEGYSAHSPSNDKGVITPTAAISSIPYTPEESMKVIRFLYYQMGDKLWGDHGFYDAFNPTVNWVADSYLAIDQGPIICMIENHRSGLLWDLFMSSPEIQEGLEKLGFTY